MTHGFKIDKQNGAYFLTFTVVEWMPVFQTNAYKLILCDSLNFCIKEKGLEIFAYVLMDTHMHLLAASNKNHLSDIVRDFKKFTSSEIIRPLKEENSESSNEILKIFGSAADQHSRNKKFQVWQQH